MSDERGTAQLIESMMRDVFYLADRLRVRGVEADATKARTITTGLELLRRTRAIRDAERAGVEQSGGITVQTTEDRLAELEHRISQVEGALRNTLEVLERSEQSRLDAVQGRLTATKQATAHFQRRDEFRRLADGVQAAPTPRPTQTQAHSQSSSQRCNRLRL